MLRGIRHSALGSSARRAGLALLCGAALVVVLLVSGRPARETPLPGAAFARATTHLTPAGMARARAAGWWGRVYTTSSGDTVNISVSDSYPVNDALGQSWANTFAGLVHGTELQRLHAFVATPLEVQDICGSAYALGCYGSNQLVVMGEPAHGVTPQEVAEHEYGHHVAFNRVNYPWAAVDWGTKRWATYAGICTRVAAGTAFPGNEDTNYRLNPGEAFAEAYRALNDTRTGLALTWSIVDASFIPDATALQAVEKDVVDPWTAATRSVIRGRFLVNGKRVWTHALTAPLDGLLTLSLSLPKGGVYKLALLAPDRKTVLATGLWSGVNLQTLSFTLCGQRSLLVRVVRAGAAGRFTLALSQP